MDSTAPTKNSTFVPRISKKVAIALSLLALLVTAGCSSDSDPKDADPTSQSSESSEARESTASPSASAVQSVPEFCEPTDAIGREILPVGAPTSYLQAKRYTLVLDTNCGNIEIAADAAKAPATVTTIGFLANAKYYDASVCHRLTTEGIFVLQCGDPSATGAGGPGFTFKDENLPSASGVNYPKGTIAMANSGANKNGSQFFIVYQDTTLPPNYTIWGEVIKGLDIVEQIAANGTANGQSDGSPKYPVEIRSARLL
jgi:peptidyl-prolyl cis-trans isomerase B (cyclophilin B)